MWNSILLRELLPGSKETYSMLGVILQRMHHSKNADGTKSRKSEKNEGGASEIPRRIQGGIDGGDWDDGHGY